MPPDLLANTSVSTAIQSKSSSVTHSHNRMIVRLRNQVPKIIFFAILSITILLLVNLFGIPLAATLRAIKAETISFDDFDTRIMSNGYPGKMGNMFRMTVGLGVRKTKPYVYYCKNVVVFSLSSPSSGHLRRPLVSRFERHLRPTQAVPIFRSGHKKSAVKSGIEHLAWRQGLETHTVDLFLIDFEQFHDTRLEVLRLLSHFRKDNGESTAVVLLKPLLRDVLSAEKLSVPRKVHFEDTWIRSMKQLENDMRKKFDYHDELEVKEVLVESVYLPWNRCMVPV